VEQVMGRLDGHQFWRLTGISALVVIASATVAYAVGGGGGGVNPAPIIGCVNDQSGFVRIVSSSTQFRPSEHLVQFEPFAGPASLSVDCTAGQSVNQALGSVSPIAPSVSITIKGICTASVSINRDNVTLQGADTSSGLQSPSSNSDVLSIGSARNISINQLILQGGGTGLGAGSGAIVSVNGGVIRNNSTFAAFAHDGGSIHLDGGVLISGTAAGCCQAVAAFGGSSVSIQHATIQNNPNNLGVFAFVGASIDIGPGALVQNTGGASAADGGSLSVREGHVTHNSSGVSADGAHLLIQDGALIDHNSGSGVSLRNGSTLRMQNATVNANGQNGIELRDTSTADLSGISSTNNGGWGILCEGPPAVAQILTETGIGNVSGNTAGQINCPLT